MANLIGLADTPVRLLDELTSSCTAGMCTAQDPQRPRQVRRADQPAVKADLHAIMKPRTIPQARSAARRFADRWQDDCPKAVSCLRDDLDELLTCWQYKSLAERKKVRTTNAIERRFREVRRRTRPMGVFSERTSMDHIFFAVFNHENHNEGVSNPLLLTQTF